MVLECRPYVENYTVDASIFDSTLRCRIMNVLIALFIQGK